MDVEESLVIENDCFGNALRFATVNQRQGWQVVHGLVTNRINGTATRQLAHGWNEIEHEGVQMVYDPSRGEFMSREDYYWRGSVEHVCRYSLIEASSKAIVTEELGPWDDVLIRYAKHMHTTKFKPRRRRS